MVTTMVIIFMLGVMMAAVRVTMVTRNRITLMPIVKLKKNTLKVIGIIENLLDSSFVKSYLFLWTAYLPTDMVSMDTVWNLSSEEAFLSLYSIILKTTTSSYHKWFWSKYFWLSRSLMLSIVANMWDSWKYQFQGQLKSSRKRSQLKIQKPGVSLLRDRWMVVYRYLSNLTFFTPPPARLSFIVSCITLYSWGNSSGSSIVSLKRFVSNAEQHSWRTYKLIMNLSTLCRAHSK